MKKVFLTIILLVVLVGAGIAIGVSRSNQQQTPTSTVEMDLNPNAVFTVNENNVVLSVTFTNEDADLIFSDIKTVGRKMDEVAKDFAQKAIEASSALKEYISISANASSDGDTNVINITITGNQKQAEALQQAVVDGINEVFDENGIFGRAVASISTQTTDLVNKYSDIAQKLQIDVAEFANKTEAEILAIIQEQSSRLQGLVSSQLDDVYNYINGSVIQPLQNAVEQLESEIATHQANIEEWEETYGDYIPEAIKQQINQAKEFIKDKQAEVKTKMAEINKKIDDYVKTLRDEAKTQFAQLKTELNNRIQAHKAELEAHIESFEANKQAVLADIQAWRDSFNA